MSARLKLLSQHVNRVLADDTRPLFLVVDDEFRLQEWRGNGERYGFPKLQTDMPLDRQLAILATADTDDDTPRAWRFVELPGAHVCHVHSIRLPGGWGVALLDASIEHAEQHARQQVAHELLLLRNERDRLISELEQANRLKSDFIARMSHEFRTPLTSVMGYSDQLREIRADDPEAQRHLKAVGRGARHLLNLVENLLDQARIEMDQLTLNPGGCDLQELSDEVEQLLRPVAHQKQLSLAWWFDAEIPPRLWLDATRLKQILINLVGNAIKFTERGGVNVEFDWQDERLQVSVTDTGPGIPDSDIDNIFEPFQQGGNSSQAKGAGLGLAISQTLVRAMGGEIELSTRKGEGSRFSFGISAPAVKGGRTANLASLRGRKILVADDDPDLLELFRLYLGSTGCEVRTEQDGAGTLNSVRRSQPDVVLLDLNLGNDKGESVASQLRVQGFRNTIVALSASQPGTKDETDSNRAFDARWTKPISRTHLLEGLAGLIG